MPAGTPIRLVRENGDTIELDAQSMVLTTSRKVGGKPLPFAGSRRIGMDLNMNSAMINIQGIISDDRIASGGSTGEAVINFGKIPYATTNETGIFAETGTYGADNNLSGLVGSVLKLRNRSMNYVGVDGDSVTFTNTIGSTAYSATGGAGSTPTVLVNTTNATATQIATAVAALINAQYSTDFTATPIDAEDYADLLQSNIAVHLSMVTTGEVLNNSTPFFSDYSESSFSPPALTHFSGGATSTKKSAGDKAMDLYGTLNNSLTIAGGRGQMVGLSIAAIGIGAGLVMGGGAAIVGAFGYGTATAVTAGGVAGGAAAIGGAAAVGTSLIGALGNAAFNKQHAYILGIQIPYNSMIQAGDGELYTARNFFMPTGISNQSDAATSSAVNIKSAGEKMTWGTGDYTGIQGSVQKMDITYNAGETVYEFNMIFAPVDNLL